MLLDATVVDLMAAIYAAQPQGFDHVDTTGGIFWGMKVIPPYQIFVPRGSKTIQDWQRDFESEVGRHLVGYPQLGLMPDGFSAGVVETTVAMIALIAHDLIPIIGGHSLGAAHAVEIAGLFEERGNMVRELVLCGCPRPGTDRLWAVLSTDRVVSYINKDDPVPDVPVPVNPILPWVRYGDIPIDVPPTVPDDIDPFRSHHIGLYQQGVRAMGLGLDSAPALPKAAP